jgi:hypothetical protein
LEKEQRNEGYLFPEIYLKPSGTFFMGRLFFLKLETIILIPGVIYGGRLKRWDLKLLGKIFHLIP